MKFIRVVGWDADRVAYNDISTSICSRASKLDPKPYVDKFINARWFSNNDVKRWEDYRQRRLESVADTADMLTDFLYQLKKGDKSVITKEQTIEGKQSLLAGLSIAEIEEISNNVIIDPGYTTGFQYCVSSFEHNGFYQTMFSDGLGPFINRQIERLRLDAGGGIPPMLSYNGQEFEYTPSAPKEAKLTGRISKFNKTDAFFRHLKEKGFELNEVAVIDDSGSNVETLHVPVKNGGGVALGFNVTDAHRPNFQKYGIPILKGKDLVPFAEIVADPRKINLYCE